MGTVKISDLSVLPAVVGNVLIPVVSNVAGSFTTVKANVNQIRSFILGSLTTSDLANLSANVNTLFSNAASQASSLAQLFANAAVQSGELAALVANSGAQSGQITQVQSNLNTANASMRAYVDSAISANVGDILNGTTFTGNIVLGNLVLSETSGVSGLYAQDTNGNINLLPSGSGTVNVHNHKISNVSDPTDTQDVVTLNYLNTVVSTGVTNLIADDTELVLTDNGSNAGVITARVDGVDQLRINAANIEQLTDVVVSGNIIPSTDVTYNLGSSTNQWASLWVSNSTVYIGGSPLTVLNNNLIVNGYDISANLVTALIDIDVLQSNVAAIEPNVATLLSNAEVQHTTLLSLLANVAQNSSDIDTLQQNVLDIVSNSGNLTVNVSVLESDVSTLQGNVLTIESNLATLFANAVTQANLISILTANAGVQGQQLDTLTANAASQAGILTILTANIAVHESNIATLFANAAVQAGILATLNANAVSQHQSILNLESNIATFQYSNAKVASYLPVYGGAISTAGIINSNANGVGNIGNAATKFNTIFAVATSAQYADLAEKYLSDVIYAAGTVVVFGGDKEITVSSTSHDTRVAGVISQNPAYIMNSDLDQGQLVALVGRVPCQVTGKVSKGDLLVQSDQPGVAIVLNGNMYKPGCVIGKALENKDSNELGIIEIAVGKI